MLKRKQKKIDVLLEWVVTDTRSFSVKKAMFNLPGPVAYVEVASLPGAVAYADVDCLSGPVAYAQAAILPGSLY